MRGYPQDMWMPKDEVVDKPETHRLRPSWSGAVQGMMALVRIFPLKEYGQMIENIRKSG